MAEYLAPGVYVEEVSTGARPISAVGTSTAVFFGCAPRPDAELRKPTFVTNWSSFERTFVTPPEERKDAEGDQDEETKGKDSARTKSKGGDTSDEADTASDDDDGEQPEDPPRNILAAAVAGFFANGGSRLYVVNLGEGVDSIAKQDLALVAATDGISIVAAPGYTDKASYTAIVDDCAKRGDRIAVLDGPEEIVEIGALTKPVAKGGLRPPLKDKGYAAFYVPWIEVTNPLGRNEVMVPPSGHICGAYALTDGTRGVHKAPANITLRGALGVAREFSKADQEILNPESVNCIRSFDSGIRIWGARTLSPASSEYRYVPVRRLVTMISQSIQRGTEWVVFEPNDLTLWKSLRRDIGNFLHTLWRDGALAGARPEDAYFIKCDAETTTQADIDEGRVIALIGIAPVKPAEFVIIRIGQSVGASTVEGA